PPAELKKKEAGVLLEYLSKEDWLVALDERGRSLRSEGLAQLVQGKANDATKNLIFLIGGAYGLDDTILHRAGDRWSLSELTFPHQLVRLLLSEQLYRACTILRNEKYHHQ
ncbi:MAG TPA: 23S rRNA (pseudouridine(1915)-N(3))-methyltransferase RlmH, partial [Puia sp.]|nr:23S rRNA (pseudouridine(1915)-N(3))-methyltransferase RlmH [Puia sp.]